MNYILGLLILGPATRLSAEETVPQRPVLPQWRVLEGLVGTWDAQVTGGSADVFGKPLSAGRITREWVADHQFVHERGSRHEAFLTYDARRNMYRAWYFHDNGHVWELAGRWTGASDSLSVSAELDQNQSLARRFQLLDDKRQECTISWTDEDGRSGLYGTLNFTRCDPAAAARSGKKPAAGQPQPSPPAEMKILEKEVGKWTFQSSATTGDKTIKLSGSRLVQWILGGQFLQATTTAEGRQGEAVSIAGFDAATKSYRWWYFDPDGPVREPATGTWDEKERTMTWKCQMTGDLSIVSKKQWINADTTKTHAVFSRQNGDVYSTQDDTMTRQK
jgi:hypothetical protein